MLVNFINIETFTDYDIHIHSNRLLPLIRSLNLLIQLKEDIDNGDFVNLYDAAIWEHAYIYTLGVLQMFVVLKFLKLLKFIKRMLTLQMVR